MIIPFTKECYEHINDDDYRPLPGEKTMDIERDIDSVVEAHRAADVDALVDGNGDAQWQRDDVPSAKLPPAASLLAVALGDAWRAYSKFDGLISISPVVYSGRPGVFVTYEYFQQHYGSEPDIERLPIPAHSAIELSIDVEGTRIYCWQDAKFEMVAA